MTTINLEWVRAQFPALAEQMNGRPVVYFDGPGGTQVPRQVIDAFASYFTHANSNTHGNFLTSQRTDATIAEARAAMADFLGCDADEVVFGPNMTTLTFAFSRAFGRTLQPGDEIVLTRLDHDANFSPWKALEEQGAVIKIVDIDVEDCTLDMQDFASKLSPRTRLVAVGYASNAVGTINPVAEIVRMAHEVGALVYIDAVHYAPHGPIDVRALDCDFLACSPYKFFAPHTGTLYGKREHLEHFQPYKVRPSDNYAPDRWETGTKSHESMAGVTAAIEYLADLGRQLGPSENRRAALLQAMHAIQSYERELGEHLIAGLLQIPGLHFYGIRELERFHDRTPTVAVRIDGLTPEQLAAALGDEGIFTWNGNYYAINLTERLGVEESGGMLRIGLVHYNTIEEVDRLLDALQRIVAGTSQGA